MIELKETPLTSDPDVALIARMRELIIDQTSVIRQRLDECEARMRQLNSILSAARDPRTSSLISAFNLRWAYEDLLRDLRQIGFMPEDETL